MPALAKPNMMASAAAPLRSMTATRSPGATPRWVSPAAIPSAMRSSAPNVSGASATRANTRSGSERARATKDPMKPSCGTKASAALALGPLGEELFHHARRLAGRERFALDAHAGLQAVAEARLGDLAEALLVEPHRDRRRGRQPARQRQPRPHHLVARDHAVHQTDGAA